MSDSDQSKKDLLRRTDLFQSLTEDYLELIASCSEWTPLEPDDELFHEGDRAEYFYILESGTLVVEQDTRQGPARHRLHPDAYLGVLSAAGQQPRMVTASASGEDTVRLLAISVEELREAMKNDPENAINVYDRLFRAAAERVQESRDIVQTMLSNHRELES